MAAAKNRRRLDVLAYRCTPRLLDEASVHLRALPDGVRSMWRILERNYRERVERDEVQAPYSVAMNALRCLTGGYVHFDPKRLFLVSSQPIDNDTLRDTFTLFCGLASGMDIDDIDLSSPTALAERIADTPQQQRRLAGCLRRSQSGQSDVEPWVYKSATWELSRSLTAEPWHVDGKKIKLRSDSEGGFIAWNDPWPNKRETAFAFARGRIAMKTMPNIGDPLILLSASATRLKKSMTFARTVLAEQADATRPIVEFEMAGRGRIRSISRMSLQVLGRLGMDQSILHGIQARINAERAELDAAEAENRRPKPLDLRPGRIRPIQSRTYKFPVGRGVGMYFLRELDAHFRKVFGDTAESPNIYVDIRGFKRLDPKDGLLPKPPDVVRSLATMGFTHLRFVCLWYRDENKLRMIQQLADAYNLDANALDPVEGTPIPLFGDVVSVVFHEVPSFLKHGPNAGRTADLADVSSIPAEPGVLIGVWAETEYADGDDEVDEEQEAVQVASTVASQSGRPSEREDAKHRARRSLAELGAVSQFIKDRVPDASADHPALLAHLDLHRSLGIIDTRIDNVMVDAIGPAYSAGTVAHCGIHVRRQSKRPGERAARICVTAAVLKPPTKPSEAWTLHGWSYTTRQWQPYPQAQAAFHAKDYPTGKLTEELVDNDQGYKKVAKIIDEAIGELSHYIDRIPYTVTVDGLATRRLWDGLHNKKQGMTGRPGSTWVPGHTLPLKERPIAIIRLNKDHSEVPTPIRVTRLDGNDEVIGGTDTTRLLYRVEPDFGDPVWLLVTVPFQYDGAGAGRLGDDKTRWTADPGSNVQGELRRNEIKANWYSMNATEIFIMPMCPDVDLSALAKMTARLCHQPLAWTSRTRYPVHLHAANQMDQDHPQYRRSAQGEDREAVEVGEARIDDSLTDE